MNLAEALEFQANSCGHIGSPFYAAVLKELLEQQSPDHSLWRLFDDWEGDYGSGMPALRFLGAVHHLALSGRAPEIAAHFQSTGGDGDGAAAAALLPALIEREREFIRRRLEDQVQTNEVRRSAALLPGFLLLAEKFGLPLRLLELGSSAGLLLCWDRYFHQLGESTWGPEDSPVVLHADYHGPPLVGEPVVASRLGCDIAPLDVSQEEDRLRLQSFVWPDQAERFTLMAKATELASEIAPEIRKQPAAEFVAKELQSLPSGQLTVVFHSIFWMYMSDLDRERTTASIEAAGARASADSPLAWLRLEFATESAAFLQLDVWPDHTHRKLAECHYHGTSLRWESDDLS